MQVSRIQTTYSPLLVQAKQDFKKFTQYLDKEIL